MREVEQTRKKVVVDREEYILDKAYNVKLNRKNVPLFPWVAQYSLLDAKDSKVKIIGDYYVKRRAQQMGIEVAEIEQP